jgi:hypothetical protein
LRTVFISIWLILLVSCEGILNLEVIGDGNLVSPVRRNLNAFSEIEFYDAFELEIHHSTRQEVSIQADSNLLRYITTEVIDDRLIIQRLPNYDLFPKKPIRILIYSPDIREIDVYGSGSVTADSLKADRLELNIYSRARVSMKSLEVNSLSVLSNSGGSLFVDGWYDKLFFRQAGSGHAELKGGARDAQIIQEGSGVVEARSLFTDSVFVRLFGSGLIYFRSGEYSSVSIEGKGRVYFSGSDPQQTSIEGGGSLFQH